MRWDITENEECLCPGLLQEDIPHRLPINLHVLQRHGQFYLNAQNIAGVVPFENGHSITIIPKYPEIDPITLLLYANGNNILDSDDKISQFSSGDNGTDFSGLYKMFIDELRILQQKPLKFSRMRRPYLGYAIKGHVDWVSTERLHQSGKLGLIKGEKNEAVTLIPENAVIALAARRILPLFPKNSSEYALLYSWACIPAQDRHLESYIASVERYIKQRQFGGAHGYLYRAVVLAEVLLGYGGMVGGTDYETDAMLFNMPSLYEDAMRTAFQRVCGPLGLTCQKGFAPRSFLFSSGDCEIIPDITIYDGVDAVAILDVKYKTPDSKDFYQIYTYMVYAGLNIAHIISPAVSDDSAMVAYDGRKIILHKVEKSDPRIIEAMAQRVVKSVI